VSQDHHGLSIHERLVRHEASVRHFTANLDVSFTNNAGEWKIRMAKVKVSGCFRTRHHAEAWCGISSYPSSMAALGYNPLAAIQIALAGNTTERGLKGTTHNRAPTPGRGPRENRPCLSTAKSR